MSGKQEITLRVGGVEVSDYTATATFTTDALEWEDLDGFSINVWFPVLNGTDPQPTIDIEVSNTPDLLSFNPLINPLNTQLTDLNIPALWNMGSVNAKYIRFVYKSTGVNLGSTVTFNLTKLKDHA